MIAQTKTGNIFTIILTALFTFSLFCPPAAAQYGGGTGEPNNPYLIYTAEQMNTIGTEPNDWDKHFKLMTDIDLARLAGAQFNIIGHNWAATFSGVFDGNGHAISNFSYISTDRDYIGLFGYVGKYGTHTVIKDLRLVNPSIDTGIGDNVGSLAGYISNANITNCFIEGGTISGGDNIGGLIGYCYDSAIFSSGSNTRLHGEESIGGIVGRSSGAFFLQCQSNAVIIGSRYVGGILGRGNGKIDSCNSAGSVSGENGIGGLVGYNSATIESCYSTSIVTGTGEGAGGLIGNNRGQVISCKATGDVQGNKFVGGFSGTNYSDIKCCYATGVIQGNSSVAGFVGSNSIRIRFSYSTGRVVGGESVSGFANGGSVYLCYWDTETSGISESVAGKGRTTAQMQSVSTYCSWGYDNQWILDEGNDYPRLIWENTPGELLIEQPRSYDGGSGEPNDPYRISSAAHLISIAYYLEDYDKHFVLTNDIDLRTIDQREISPIGNQSFPFVGSFIGNNYKISNLACHANGQNYIGLFGCIGQKGNVENVRLVDVSIAGSGDVGGLVGYNSGIIKRSTITGTVNGGDRVGGLIGSNNGTIQQCHLYVNVGGKNRIGGLIGYSGGSIIECSTSGQVTGNQYVGGIIGYDRQADIQASFSTCSVSGRKNVGGVAGTNEALSLPAGQAGPPPGSIPLPPGKHIMSCYFTGYVEGQENIGGLIGENGGSVQFCYSAGRVININSISNDQISIGGLIGKDDCGVVLLSYWDTEIAGTSDNLKFRGRTTEQLMTTDTFRGWGYTNKWVLDEGRDYPRLAWEESGGEPIVDTINRYSGGTGELNDPYRISTTEDFVSIGYNLVDWNKCFLLTNDLDLNDIDSAMLLPIGVYGMPFVGVFDGNNCTVSNFRCISETESYLGVFGSIGPEIINTYGTTSYDPNYAGFVLNLNIKNAEVLAYCCAGGLAGYNNGIVSNCSVTGNMTAVLKNAGGLLGYNVGEITNCKTECNVTSEKIAGGLTGCNTGPVTACNCIGNIDTDISYTGGLIGINYDNIESCHFNGTVTGGIYTGGLIGMSNNIILNSSASGEVTGTSSVGGLVGEHNCKRVIQGSFSNSIVTGEYSVGGLAGYNAGEILNCYAEGSVNGRRYVAGLVGVNYESILFCYTNCTVSGTQDIAGLVATSRWGEITSCFWDVNISDMIDGIAGQDPDPEGVIGLSTAEMQTADTFLDAGWDFVNETENGTEDIWWIDEGRDYPRLWWELLE